MHFCLICHNISVCRKWSASFAHWTVKMLPPTRSIFTLGVLGKNAAFGRGHFETFFIDFIDALFVPHHAFFWCLEGKRLWFMIVVIYFGISCKLSPKANNSVYSEPSLQRQHLFPKILPLKWICCCKEFSVGIMVCNKCHAYFNFFVNHMFWIVVRIASLRRF